MSDILEFLNSPLAVILALPLIGAVIGWLTNFLAVKMLFHPREPWRLPFFTVQGVFPKRQKALAHKLGQIVSTELISASEITKKLSDKATAPEVVEKVADGIEHVLVRKIPVVFPMVELILNTEMVRQVRSVFMPDLRDMISSIIADLSSELHDEFDVHEIVEEKVANFSSDKLEEILFDIMRREFRFIELVGAVLGFLIGLAQVGWIYAGGLLH